MKENRYYYHLTDLPAVPTTEEQAALIGRAQEGDAVAAAALVNGVMKLVIITARSIATEENLPAERFADAVHEGVVGCYSALNKFDPSFGYKFWTYALWYVENAVRTFCITGLIKVHQATFRAAAAGRDDITAFTAKKALASRNFCSLAEGDDPASESADPYQELVNKVDRRAVLRRLYQAIGELPARDRFMIRERYFKKASLEAIAARVGRCREWVRLRLKKIAKKLRGIIER